MAVVHTGRWVDERAPMVKQAARVKLADPEHGYLYAVLDIYSPNPLAISTDDVVTVVGMPHGLADRHYKAMGSVKPAIGLAIRCPASPTPAP